MNRLISFTCFVIVFCFLLIGTQQKSFAALVNFDFTAEITSASGSFSGVSGIFTGGAIFEERTGGSSNPSTYLFMGSPFNFYANVPSAPINLSSCIIEVADNYGLFGDYVVIGRSTSDYIYSADFVTRSDSVFSGNDIPSISILNNFQDGLFNVYDLQTSEIVLQADIISHNFNAVPIPGAVWLLGTGLVGFIGFRKRMKI